ncbi:glycosyltransferase family 2 protein [Candidatus Uhrbacteria bacterium]|nr:glycosyltransferase family 2 protein [Candidatus Uhrbacteria bacterium]
MKSNVWVVIAAYNEAPVIRSVVEDARAYADHVVVVDDDSGDTTADEAFAGGATVLCHPINRGQGASLQTGTTYALQNGADVIIHFDADGQHDASDIPRFAEAIERGFDVVLGSRFLEHAKAVPQFRRFILRCGVLFTWAFSGIKLTDTHNGFRALSRRAASQIFIHENRMAHSSEILHEIVRQKIRWTEVSTRVLYTDYSRSRGQSSWNALSIVGRILWRNFFLH